MLIDYFIFCFLLVAMVMDIRCYKVKNQLILSGFAIGTLLLFYENGLQAIGKGFISLPILFLLLFPLYAIQVVGAADVKIFLLLGFLLGIKPVLYCVLLSLLAGAVYSLLQMLFYKNLLERLGYFLSYIGNSLTTNKIQPYHKVKPDKKAVIHFTIPIFISFCIYWMKGDISWITF